MPHHSSKSRRIASAAQLRALGSATRQEIVDVLGGAGASSVAQLAELMGRRPDALYFHLRLLERVGLVVACPEEQGDTGVRYRLPASGVTLDYAGSSRRELARVVRLALKLSQREFERECLSGADPGTGASRRFWGGRVVGWVDDAGLARVNELLAELHCTLRAGRPGGDRRPVSLGFLLAPSGRGERIRTSTRRSRTRTKPPHKEKS